MENLSPSNDTLANGDNAHKCVLGAPSSRPAIFPHKFSDDQTPPKAWK